MASKLRKPPPEPLPGTYRLPGPLPVRHTQRFYRAATERQRRQQQEMEREKWWRENRPPGY